ncbi:MAG: DUF1295 domain-containing protein [Myxococcales bacterium]|nr:DUF1295 domain-containing protein [Myxococcales bacterium]
MSHLDAFGASLAIALSAMTLLWLVSLARRDASVVDPFWGAAFALVAWGVAALAGTPISGRPLLLLALVSAWAARLTAYLLWRSRGKGEDYRYRAMRERWGDRFPLVSLGTVFLLQGALVAIVSLPVQHGLTAGAVGPLGLVDVVGAAIVAIGLFFEAVGDAQLAAFKADPDNRGQVMDRGLWRYTRHPNYFGDFCVWWGLFLVSQGGAFAWWTLVGPVVMSTLLLRVSGVALLESTITERRPAYAAYIRRTSTFFPWPPRADR